MRFFTMAWWRDVQAGSAANPTDAYERHLASLRPLPTAIAELDGLPSLHDARFVRLDRTGDSLELVLDRWGERGAWMRTKLLYGGVEGLTLSADPDGALPGPIGLGDLGYYELDTVAPGLFEHRLLFSSGIELSVQFRSFTAVSGEPPPGPANDWATADRDAKGD